MFQIAIDGPSGSGKSTIAKKLAKRLTQMGHETIYIDTGAMFRAMAYFLSQSISDNDLKDENLVASACEEADIELCYQDDTQHVLVNGKDVTKEIRQESIGTLTSHIASNPAVRRRLLERQQEMAKCQNVVMDGRDIATCVLPDATVKIYLDASASVRARRRCDQLLEAGSKADYQTVLADIEARDERDRNRTIAPLKVAKDATVIDSSKRTLEEVEEEILSVWNKQIAR